MAGFLGAVVAAAGLAGLAAAGSEDAPEITDPSGDASNPVFGNYGDILAAWIEAETPDAFTTVVKLAGFSDPQARGASAGVAFHYNGVDYYTLAFYDQNGAAGFWYGHIDRAALSPLDQNTTTGEIHAGQPAYLRAVFPKAFILADVPNGTAPAPKGPPERLADLEAGTLDFKVYGLGATAGASLASPMSIDDAGGTQTYDLVYPVRPAPPPATSTAGNNTTALDSTSAPPAAPVAAKPASTPWPSELVLAAMAAGALLASAAPRKRRGG